MPDGARPDQKCLEFKAELIWIVAVVVYTSVAKSPKVQLAGSKYPPIYPDGLVVDICGNQIETKVVPRGGTYHPPLVHIQYKSAFGITGTSNSSLQIRRGRHRTVASVSQAECLSVQFNSTHDVRGQLKLPSYLKAENMLFVPTYFDVVKVTIFWRLLDFA